jgi:hypothetical protein
MLAKYSLSMQYSPHISEDLGRESHIWIIIKADGLSIAWCPQISKGLQSLARAYSITHYFKWKLESQESFHIVTFTSIDYIYAFYFTSILIMYSMFVIDFFQSWLNYTAMVTWIKMLS